MRRAQAGGLAIALLLVVAIAWRARPVPRALPSPTPTPATPTSPPAPAQSAPALAPAPPRVPATPSTSDAPAPSPPSAERHVVAGTVVAKETGEPVAGLLLRLSLDAEDTPNEWRTATDAAGHFESPRELRDGSVLVEAAEASGFVTFMRGGRLPLGTVRLSGADVLDARLEFPWSGVVVGRVLATDGQPISGAEVLALTGAVESESATDGGWPVARTSRAARTDEVGRFLLSQLPTDLELVVVARADGYVVGRAAAVRAAPRDGAPMEFRLVRPGVIRGRVERADGRPFAGAVVWVMPREEGAQVAAHPTTDARGAFEVPRVPPGRHDVQARFGGALVARTHASDPVVVDVGAITEVVLRASEAPTIAGIVVGSDGQPHDPAVLRKTVGWPLSVQIEVEAPGARPTWQVAGSQHVEADGHFRWVAEPGRRYRLSVRSHGLDAGSDPVEAEAGGADVRLVWNAPDRRLRVTVVDALHEEPIPGARVTLLSGDAVEGDPTTDQPRTPLYATDNHGRCHELWLRAGKAIIVVVARGKAPVRLPVELRDGDPQPREVRVQVEPGRHVEGKVVDGKGRPVAGVRVAPLIGFWAAYDEGGATTDAEGKFALDALPAEGGFVGVVDKDGMVDARTAATARDLVLVTGRGP